MALAALAPAGCARERPVGGTSAPVPRPAPAPPPVAPAPSPPAPTPAVTIDTGGERALFHVQVAATPEARAAGLVGRPTLASDAGILFVFERTERQALSTKDTLLPVDIVFIGPDRRIVGVIPQARPQQARPHRSAAPSRYALEIRGGLAAKLRLRVGQPVELRAIPGQ
jgi:uncharacterized protein